MYVFRAEKVLQSSTRIKGGVEKWKTDGKLVVLITNGPAMSKNL